MSFSFEDRESNHALLTFVTDLDPRAVDLEDGLPDGEGAVVPDGQEEEEQVQDPGVEVKRQARDHAT